MDRATRFIHWPKQGELGTKFTDQLLSHPVRQVFKE